MAAVEWADAIKTVSGALVKINKKSPHAADQKMVLGTHRTAATTSKICSRLYLRGLSSVTRSTPPSVDEMTNRTRFSAVSIAVKTRMKDLSKISGTKQRSSLRRTSRVVTRPCGPTSGSSRVTPTTPSTTAKP